MATVAAISVSALALPRPAAAQASAKPCEVGEPLVDAVYQMVNEQDLASNGDV